MNLFLRAFVNVIQVMIFFSLLLTESRGFLYNVFCAGGIDKENPLNPKDNRENGMMVFFRDRFGPILNNKWTKALVMLLFLGYLAISTMGVTQLKEGLERRKLSRYDSYSVEYYETDDLYFREYPYRVNVSQSLNFFLYPNLLFAFIFAYQKLQINLDILDLFLGCHKWPL